MRKHLLTFGFVILSVGCSTQTAIKVNSNPAGAEVYIKPLAGGEKQGIGKTPLANDNLAALLKGGAAGALIMEIEKPDYITTTIVLPEVIGATLEISQELKPIPKTAIEEEKAKEAAREKQRELEKKTETANLNKSLEQLFEAQRLARVGRLDDALKSLDEVQKVSPQISSIHEMRGGIFYLQKDFNKALDEYRKAALLNTENPSVNQMIKKLEGQGGGNATSNSSTPGNSPTETK